MSTERSSYQYSYGEGTRTRTTSLARGLGLCATLESPCRVMVVPFCFFGAIPLRGGAGAKS